MPSRTATSSFIRVSPKSHRHCEEPAGDAAIPTRSERSRRDCFAAHAMTDPFRSGALGVQDELFWSIAGQRAVFLPEAADRSLAGAEGLRLGGVAAHHHDTAVFVIVVQRPLNKATDAPILHRDITGSADEIALAQPALGHRLVVVFKAQMDPFELGLLEPARADDANRDRIADLLQHHAREHSQDLNRD